MEVSTPEAVGLLIFGFAALTSDFAVILHLLSSLSLTSSGGSWQKTLFFGAAAAFVGRNVNIFLSETGGKSQNKIFSFKKK